MKSATVGKIGLVLSLIAAMTLLFMFFAPLFGFRGFG